MPGTTDPPQRQLYPAELARDSLEALFEERSTRTRAIYLAVLAFVAAALAALPLVSVPVTVESPGVVRPLVEKQEVRAGASGIVDRMLARENQHVGRGDPVLVLRAAALDEQTRALSSQIDQHRRDIHDLSLLAGAATGPSALPAGAFATPRFAQAYLEYRQARHQGEVQRDQAARELARANELSRRQLAPPAELEEKQFALDRARAESATVDERSRAEWEAALTQARTELQQLQAQLQGAEDDRTLRVVRAPVDGTIGEMRGLSAGSYVTAGDVIASLSPSSALVVDVFVSPRDVGLIRAGGPVRVQVDAFDYNDWGTIAGRVDAISDDFVMVNAQPVFKVRCTLERPFLQLRNGFRGRLRKGMSVRARFLVTRRTLYRLLFDRVDDWLDPSQTTPAPPTR